MRFASYVFIVISLFGITGCNLLSDSERGTITINLTDMPFPFDDALSANVTIERVELVGKSDSTNTFILSDSSQTFNLLELQNGITAPLALSEIPDGDFSQLRLIVNEDASVVMNDSTVFDLKIPSGSQTGIKINIPDVDFGTSDAVEVTIDFNVAESFVVRGNPNTAKDITGFIFKPVLKIESFEINDIPVEIGE